MTESTAQQRFLRTWALWTAGFLAFPFAGLAGTAAAGRVDDAGAALVGGLVTGLVVGAAQALVSRRRLDPLRWLPATAVGMGAGLLLGAWAVDYSTSLADLAVMGALTGLILGPAQALALPPRTDTAGPGRSQCRPCGRSAGSSPLWPAFTSRTSSPSSASPAP